MKVDLNSLKMYIADYKGNNYTKNRWSNDYAMVAPNEILWTIDEIVKRNNNDREIM